MHCGLGALAICPSTNIERCTQHGYHGPWSVVSVKNNWDFQVRLLQNCAEHYLHHPTMAAPCHLQAENCFTDSCGCSTAEISVAKQWDFRYRQVHLEVSDHEGLNCQPQMVIACDSCEFQTLMLCQGPDKQRCGGVGLPRC